MSEWVTLGEACHLLSVSRPTLNTYRKKYRIRESNLKRQILLSKIDLIKKVLLKRPSKRDQNFTVFDLPNIHTIQPLPGIFDLRNLKQIDPYGVINLLCCIKNFLEDNPNHKSHLILSNSETCSYLDSIDFFSAISRGYPGRVIMNQDDVIKRKSFRSTIICPLVAIGYRGAEKKIIEDLSIDLIKQGFTESYCAYLSWILGELCDNAHTHSRKMCYFLVEPLNQKSSHTRTLSISIGDIGIGIQESMRLNSRYAQLNSTQALVQSFQSHVSGMELELKRGKGLNDLLALTKGNKSWVQVDSNESSILFDFRKENSCQFINSVFPTKGTRFYIVLTDSHFQKIPRKDIDNLIIKTMEIL